MMLDCFSNHPCEHVYLVMGVYKGFFSGGKGVKVIKENKNVQFYWLKIIRSERLSNHMLDWEGISF